MKNKWLKLYLISSLFGLFIIFFAILFLFSIVNFECNLIGILFLIFQMMAYGLFIFVFGKFFLFYSHELDEIEHKTKDMKMELQKRGC